MKKLPFEAPNCGLLNRMGYDGMAFLLWICFAKGLTYISPRLRQHETIHFWQQVEMLFVLQWAWYIVEWLVRMVQYRKYRNPKAVNKSAFSQVWDKAYYNISFEREAYANGGKDGYLNERKVFAWIKYLRIK
jgi:hypothetical protein